MSLPFSSGIGRYAEDMGTWCENMPRWCDIAAEDLRERDLADRCAAILEGDSETLETERHMAVLALAMATGTRFEFPDGSYANGFISYMLRSSLESFELDLQEFLTPTELMELGSLYLL